jgi:hypothetical protein
MSGVQTASANRAQEIAGESRFLQLCRIGFVGRGLLYILIGLLVLGTGRTEDLTGALEYLGHGSGRLLLMGICAGMAAYGLWRLADAAFGMEHPGNGKEAFANRSAAGLIGLIYLYLAYKALRILLAGDTASSSAQQQADTVLDLPGGAVMLALAAAVLAIAGLAQLRKAMSCSFLRRLDGRAQGMPVKWLGRIGYAARGIIFLVVGVLIGRAALDGQSSEAGGMEQALDLFSGPVLYAVAAGLILFGIFSIIEGLFRRIHEPPVDDIKQQVREKVGG